jgi:hypothetical protein
MMPWPWLLKPEEITLLSAEDQIAIAFGLPAEFLSLPERIEHPMCRCVIVPVKEEK